MQANSQKIPQLVPFVKSVHPFLSPGLHQQWRLHPLLLDSYYRANGILSTGSQRGLTIPLLSSNPTVSDNCTTWEPWRNFSLA